MNCIKRIIGKLTGICLTCYDFYMIEKASKVIGHSITYVSQGGGGVEIAHPEKFKIDETSHLKSGTFIECSGGCTIGKYFHTGRGLTIFTTNHIYDNSDFIPYGKESIDKPVIVKDFVWCGANVTICPGVIIG